MYKVFDYDDPFQVNGRYTRLIHFNNKKYSSMEKAALLSRYSRSTKSMIDLIESEFQDKKRAPLFIKKLLSEYGDDSIAELASETVGIEGLSVLAATKLTDSRIGISFLEKSTRYVPFTADSFYIPAEMYEMGLVDEFKELCGTSYKTFNFIYNDLLNIFDEKYPIKSCFFYDTKKQRDVLFEDLNNEIDIQNAERAHKRAIKDKSFDNAGYCWLTSLKTNIGFNSNARALEYLLLKTKQSRLSELNNLSYNLYDLLSRSIEPFIERINPPITSLSQLVNLQSNNNNPLGIYNGDNISISALYKTNMVNLFRAYENATNNLWETTDVEDEEEGECEEEEHTHDEERTEERKNKKTSESTVSQTPSTEIISSANNRIREQNKPDIKRNINLIKSLLSEIGLKTSSGSKINFKETNTNSINNIDSKSFRPWVHIVNFSNEQFCIDMLCSAILFENNENLLDYDNLNINNIDDNLRIKGVDRNKIKSGILFDMMNGNKRLEDLYDVETYVNKISENTLSFNDILAYWEDNLSINEKPVYQNYEDRKELTINREQYYLIQKYIGSRKNRRDKLGRAFEFIDYSFEISSSYRIMREFKRHRLASSIYPPVLTARNSYDSFIFPNIIMNNKHLFEEYKHLLDCSFNLYSKIIKKGNNDYITAQYALPLSTRTSYVTKMNLRQLDHLLSLRTTPQAHEEFRNMSQGIYDLLLIIHPNLVKLLEFVDLEEYSLGRLRSEFKRETKISDLEN